MTCNNVQETNSRLGRTNFLFLTYSNQSLLMDLIARDEEIFFIDVNRKLREHSPDKMDVKGLSDVSRTVVVTALSLMRNVFQCDSQTDSLLLSRQERVRCQQSDYRAVLLSHLTLQHLEPALQNFRSHSQSQHSTLISKGRIVHLHNDLGSF